MVVSHLISGEISYCADEDEKILGLVSLDFTDRDFA
jgi:hypothetical protein